jgi:hypothetical protein
MRARVPVWCLLLTACATLGAPGKGDENLPTAGVGPFRKLEGDEVPGVAPFVLDDRTMLFREPAALDDGGATVLFAVARANGKDVIVRSRATDGRAFFGTGSDTGHTPPVVLSADQPWEGDSLSGPFALGGGPGGVVFLFYAASGGIGAAGGGLHDQRWVKFPGPILADASAPAAYVGQDNQVHLFFSSGDSIGEAICSVTDTFHCERRGIVLTPSPPPAPGPLLPNEKPPFDTARVSDPTVLTRTTPAGRFHVRVLYAGTATDGSHAIGFAARYGDDGPLARNPVPVYAVNQNETAPAFVDRGDSGTFLYVQQDRRVDSTTHYAAIAAGFAPGNVHLGTPAPFPDAP